MTEPMKWEEITPEQVKLVSNGCGPKGLSWIVPDLEFGCPCDRHDFDYWLGCTKENRYEADRRFLKAMLACVDKMNKNWFSRQFYKFAAYRYYATVRMLGAKAFYFGPCQRTKDDDLTL